MFENSTTKSSVLMMAEVISFWGILVFFFAANGEVGVVCALTPDFWELTNSFGAQEALSSAAESGIPGQQVASPLRCDLYIADSTMPNAGLGVFTTKNIKPGQAVGNGDVFLPIFDLEWHYHTALELRQKISRKHQGQRTSSGNGQDKNHLSDGSLRPPSYIDPFGDYSWAGDAMGITNEVYHPYEVVSLFGPGIDAAVNSHPLLNNLDKALPVNDAKNISSMTRFHRSKSPCAGSYAPYHNATSHATHPIPAGGELFKSYGESWFLQRQRRLGVIPVEADYYNAAYILDKLLQISCNGNDNTNERNIVSIQSSVYQLISELQKVWSEESQTLNVLPPTMKLPQRQLCLYHRAPTHNVSNQRYATKRQKHGIELLRDFHQPRATRSKEWLREHGACIDHIRAGTSTIQLSSAATNGVPVDATTDSIGRGAFARRFIPRGTKITSSPLIPIFNRAMLDLYEPMPNPFDANLTTLSPPSTSSPTGKQIILNYCWGHSESTMLLCPYGSGINYINHNQSLVNVQTQWSKRNFLKHDPTWLNATVEEMWHLVHKTSRCDSTNAVCPETKQPRLVLDYVATQDIPIGTELFLDYGDAWEQAWQMHLQSWFPVPDSWSSYKSASVLNHELGSSFLLTEQEQLENPYPPNVELRCHSRVRDERPWRFLLPEKPWANSHRRALA